MRRPSSFSSLKGSLTFPPGFIASEQTPDALPSHLVVSFDIQLPPSNLLDKIARGVVETKAPADWLRSQRATHAKIVEPAQCRARNSTPMVGITKDSCEDEEPREVLRPSSHVNRRRTPQHQPSMDLILNIKLSKRDNFKDKDNQNINWLVEW